MLVSKMCVYYCMVLIVVSRVSPLRLNQGGVGTYPVRVCLPSDEPLQWVCSLVRALCTISICATNTDASCRSQAASVIVTQFFCQHKPASTFFVQLVGMLGGPI